MSDMFQLTSNSVLEQLRHPAIHQNACTALQNIPMAKITALYDFFIVGGWNKFCT